jgi:hypothetical protein
MSILIDKAIEYIEAKNANYLAKEGQIVYYTSLTGRKSDQVWIKNSMAETIRIIRATRLSIDCELKESHVLAAFQEMGRVYEFGTKSRHSVADGVFNYYTHSNIDISSQVALALYEAFTMRGFKALLGNDVLKLYHDVLKKLDSYTNTIVEKDTLIHVLEMAGYDYKTGSRRVLFGGRKVNALMMMYSTPSQIITITSDISNQIIQQIYGDLK